LAAKIASFAGDVSSVAPKQGGQFPREDSMVATINGVSVQAKCRWWNPKNCVSVLEKFSGWHPKNSVCVQANCRGYHLKILSVSSRNVHCGSQKCYQCAGELSRVASKNIRHCPREVSRVAAKYGVSVQAKPRGWHPRKCFSVIEMCKGLQQKWRQCPGE
jgi:hypothetical protein